MKTHSMNYFGLLILGLLSSLSGLCQSVDSLYITPLNPNTQDTILVHKVFSFPDSVWSATNIHSEWGDTISDFTYFQFSSGDTTMPYSVSTTSELFNPVTNPASAKTYTYIFGVGSSSGSDNDTITITIQSATSILDLNDDEGDITLYPNPTSAEIRVISEKNTLMKVELYDSSGQKLNTSTQNIINLANYDAGIYFIKVFTLQGETLTKKILKTHYNRR